MEAHLREALAALQRARGELLDTPSIDRRQVVQREIASAQTSIGRVLHLIGGRLTENP
jgi:hypothetical protein